MVKVASSSRSGPPEKCTPSAASTTHRTSSSDDMASKASVRRATRLRVRTLLWAALFIRMVATGSALETVTSPVGASLGCLAGPVEKNPIFYAAAGVE